MEDRTRKIKEYDDRLIDLRRVTRVMAGGKRFSFRATVVSGNRKGRIGLGMGKGKDVSLAIEKAKRQSQKRMIQVVLKDDRTIPYLSEAKYSAAKVLLKPARPGHGIKAGGSTRSVLELCGIKDISAKILGRTKNKATNAFAALKALEKIR